MVLVHTTNYLCNIKNKQTNTQDQKTPTKQSVPPKTRILIWNNRKQVNSFSHAHSPSLTSSILGKKTI